MRSSLVPYANHLGGRSRRRIPPLRGSFSVRTCLLLLVIAQATSSEAKRITLFSSGPTAYSGFGSSVAGIGDINTDGRDDVIVGAPGESPGRAYIFFGGPGADGLPNLTLVGESINDHFGYSVASAGDFNGDGYGDVVVGAPWNSAAGVSAGRVYLYFGGPMLDSLPDLVLTGPQTGYFFGQSVARCGDFNCDGVDDLIVGAPHDPLGDAYIFLGATSPDTLPDLNLKCATADGYDAFGISVSSGDINGDGCADAIVGAPGDRSGAADVFFGGNTPNNVADLVFNNTVSLQAEYARIVTGPGDLNRDGFDDLIVGVRHAGPGIQLFLGKTEPDAIEDTHFDGEPCSELSLGGNCDVNQDGFLDFVVASKAVATPGVVTVRVYFGAPGWVNGVPDVVWTDPGVGEGFWDLRVDGAGDFTGDGYDDIIVGAPAWQNLPYTPNNVGAVFICSIDPTVDATPPRAYGGRLLGVFPNPFNPSCEIRLSVASVSSPTTLEIFRPDGRLVRLVMLRNTGPGVQAWPWDGRDDLGMQVSSGVYYVRLRGPGWQDAQAAILVK
jgi:hypothetical protein